MENFLPRVSKEHDLICNSKKFNLKFFYNGKIIDCDDEQDLEKRYCQSELSKDYILLEADITLKNGFSFIYLRKCLNVDEKSKDMVLNQFKRVMA